MKISKINSKKFSHIYPVILIISIFFNILFILLILIFLILTLNFYDKNYRLEKTNKELQEKNINLYRELDEVQNETPVVTPECTHENIETPKYKVELFPDSSVELNTYNQFNGISIIDENDHIISTYSFSSGKIVSTLYNEIIVDDEYIFFVISVFPMGCTPEANGESDTNCLDTMSSILNDYADVGGIWSFNLTAKEFEHLVKVKKLEDYSAESILTYSIVPDSDFLFYTIESKYLDTESVKQSYILNFKTKQIIQIN